MNCRLNQCLLVAVVFILAAGRPAIASSLMEAASKGDTEKVEGRWRPYWQRVLM
jgi:hypothetical protein